MIEPGMDPFPERVARHLDEHADIVIFCRDSAGKPIGYPTRIAARRGEELLFSTYAKSAKVRHLNADPRVALLSMRPEGDDTVRWVRMTGRSEIWAPNEAEVDELFGTGGHESRVPDTVGALVRQRTLEGKRVMVRVSIDTPELLELEEASL
jgi:uncharacterized pyridoxamine 5'-phosphate oxidase family protein